MGAKAVSRPCAQALRPGPARPGGEGPPETAAAWKLGPRPRDAPPYVLANCRIIMARRIVELATRCLRSVGARPRREAWPRRRRSSTHSRRSRGRGMLRGRGLSRRTGAGGGGRVIKKVNLKTLNKNILSLSGPRRRLGARPPRAGAARLCWCCAGAGRRAPTRTGALFPPRCGCGRVARAAPHTFLDIF